MMTLLHFESMPGGGKFVYEVAHATPGPHGTTLKSDLCLHIQEDKSWCSMVIEDCDGANQKEALDRMVVWLRRLADGIEQRTEASIPLTIGSRWGLVMLATTEKDKSE